MKRFIQNALALLILIGCTPAKLATPTQSISEHHPWWETAIFYEIFVRSFYDSDGDGIGDFNGITQKLDYLTELGVNAIWLMPIQPSPSYHGYDIINYYNVNPDYGSMDDFKRLLDEVHRRGMHLIIDLVINHTSDKNPWFVDANNNPNSAYRNWYIWSDTYPGYTGPMGSAWHEGNHGYYYGAFSGKMPDLNYKNADVSAQMLKIVNFWLTDVGIDGFRVDAVKYLIEEGKKQENTTSTHDWLKNFYATYKLFNPEAFTVGEIWGAGAFAAKTYKDQLDEIFSFEMAGGFVNSAQGEANSAINSAVTLTLKDMPNGGYATFLTNHDQNRVMSVMNGKVEKAKIAAALMLTSPGTPFIYYGEEIGMEGIKPDEDIRRPMQWDGSINAGFTSATPWRAPDDFYREVNVASELSDPNSLLSFYKNFINLRKEHTSLTFGQLIPLVTENSGIYAALRGFEEEYLLIVVNLTKSPLSDYNLSGQDISLADGSYKLMSITGTETQSEMQVINHSIIDFKPLNDLAPYGINIYQLSPK